MISRVILTSLLLSGSKDVAQNLSNALSTKNAVTFHLLGGYGVVIPVYINNRGPYNFLLDTGTTVTMIDRNLAVDLDIRVVSLGAVSSLVQKIPVSIAIVSSFSFGPVVTPPLEVLIRDLKGLQASDSSIMGVLGQNALESVDFLLDYSRSRLIFDTDGGIGRLIAGVRHPLISVPLLDNPSYVNQAVCIGLNEPSSCNSLLLLDSGSASVILFRKARPIGMANRSGYVQDAAGARRLTAIYQVHLCLQDLCRTLDAQASDFLDADRRVQGLLPTSLFTKLFVSNRNHFIILDPTVSSQEPLHD